MSSMLRRSAALLVLGTALAGSPAFAQQEGEDWAPPGRVVRGSGGPQQPAIRDGEEVYLCWELGEDEISHWHDLESGYGGRQLLD